MNKSEQSQLCMLLGKLRYDVMETIIEPNLSDETREEYEEMLKAINRILVYSSIKGGK